MLVKKSVLPTELGENNTLDDNEPKVNVVELNMCQAAMGLAHYIYKSVNRISGPQTIPLLGRVIQSEICEYTIQSNDATAAKYGRMIAAYMYGEEWVFHLTMCNRLDFIRTVFVGKMDSFERDLTEARIVYSYDLIPLSENTYKSMLTNEDLYPLPHKSLLPIGQQEVWDTHFHNGDCKIVING